LSIDNTGTYDQSDEAINGDEISREDVSEPKSNLSSSGVSDPPEVDGVSDLTPSSTTNDLEPTHGLIANPPSDVSRRFSTDTVAQQVPDFEGSAEAEVPATKSSSDVQAGLTVPKSQHHGKEVGLDAAPVVSCNMHQQHAL
jgi:hypothetical protein